MASKRPKEAKKRTGASPGETVVEIDSRRAIVRLALACVAAEVFFVLADAFVNYARWSDIGAIRRLFNTTREDALASWFGVTQTFCVGLTLALIAVVSRAQADPRRTRIGWWVLAAFFLYMAMDDGSEFHERMGTAFRITFAGDDPSAAEPDGVIGTILAVFPSYTWQVVFMPLFGAMGVFMLWFLHREITSTRLRLAVVAAFGLYGLAVGFDFLEGMDLDHPWNLHAAIMQRWDLSEYDVRHFSKSFEEAFEMLAMTLLWVVFLFRLTEKAPGLHFRFGERG